MKQPHTPRWHKYYALVGCLLLMVYTSCVNSATSQLCADGDEDDKSTQPTPINPGSFRQKIFLNRTLSGSFYEKNKTLIDFVLKKYRTNHYLNLEARLVVLKLLMDHPATKVKVEESLRKKLFADAATLITGLVNPGSGRIQRKDSEAKKIKVSIAVTTYLEDNLGELHDTYEGSEEDSEDGVSSVDIEELDDATVGSDEERSENDRSDNSGAFYSMSEEGDGESSGDGDQAVVGSFAARLKRATEKVLGMKAEIIAKIKSVRL